MYALSTVRLSPVRSYAMPSRGENVVDLATVCAEIVRGVMNAW